MYNNTSSNFRVSSFRRRLLACLVLVIFLFSFVPSVSLAQQPTATISDVNIENIQLLLQQLGYDPGPVDGIMGGKTVAAITQFQQDMGLPVDGEPSAELLELLTREILQNTRPTARISVLSGTVLVNGQEQGIGTILMAGDVIETQTGATVELELSDGSWLELRENTKLDIAELSQTAAGGRVSRIKMAWGWIRAKLSPGHQQEDSSFDIETPNALIGVKFSEPDVEVGVESEGPDVPEGGRTLAYAIGSALSVIDYAKGKETIVPIGFMAVITALGIEVIKIAGTEALDTESQEAEPTELEAIEPEAIEPEAVEPKVIEPEAVEVGTTETETATTATGAEAAAGGATVGGISAKTLMIAGGIAALGGVAVVASGGGGGNDDNDLVSGRCNETQEEGENIPETRIIEMGRRSGTFEFYYDTYSVPDRIVVEYEGRILFDTGCVGEEGTVYLSYSGNSTRISVRVTPNCSGTTYTAWEFTVYCPQ